MSQLQLANVLIKILGLWMLLSGIPAVLLGALFLLPMVRHQSISGTMWFQPVVATIGPILGGILIAKSEQIARFLFKSS